MPISTQTIPIASPDVPYSLLAVQISTVPKISGGAVTNAITIVGQRYRVLDSGPDFAPQQQWVRTSAAAGSSLSNAVIAAVQAYLTAKSITNADFPNAGVQILIAPYVSAGQITGRADLIVRWYASSSGVITFATGDQWHRESYADIFAASAADSVLGAAVAAILVAVQAFVTTGGF